MLPATPGIGLKARHYDQILAADHDLQWFELHPENFMNAGGLPHRYLEAIAGQYAISMHGVGMSLGSADGIEEEHLKRLKALVDRYQPAQVSEHIAWSHGREIFHNDLLPIPYTQESLSCLCQNIDRVQNALGCQILVENPSTYLAFANAEMTEPEFLNEMQNRTGCGLLLDVNNIYVSGVNNGFDPYGYIDGLNLDAIGEIHLAGHSEEHIGTETLLIDDHGSPVTEAVWALHAYLLQKLSSPKPVLIEWDTDVPDFEIMKSQASQALEFCQACFHGRIHQLASRLIDDSSISREAS
jgi:uncharacterized protein (UPF0276 family)